MNQLRGTPHNGPMADRDNNFNLIRIAAAVAVLVSHAWPLSLGRGTVEPLMGWLEGASLGRVAVLTFFGISGYLITASAQRSHGMDFVAARCMRIMPALAVVLMATALLLGPAVTTLSLAQYFSTPRVATYVTGNLTFHFFQRDLPGVFMGNPYNHMVNDSIWTLYYEVICYIGVWAVAIAGGVRARWIGAGAVVAFAAFYMVPFDSLTLITVQGFSLPFVIGATIRVWQIPIRLWVLAPLIAGAVLLHGTPLFHEALALNVTYGALVLAFMPLRLARRYNAVGDYSYGFYIWAFPVQQTVANCWDLTPLAHIAVALPITLIFAIGSWHLIEKPALALRYRRTATGGGLTRAPASSATPLAQH